MGHEESKMKGAASAASAPRAPPSNGKKGNNNKCGLEESEVKAIEARLAAHREIKSKEQSWESLLMAAYFPKDEELARAIALLFGCGAATTNATLMHAIASLEQGLGPLKVAEQLNAAMGTTGNALDDAARMVDVCCRVCLIANGFDQQNGSKKLSKSDLNLSKSRPSATSSLLDCLEMCAPLLLNARSQVNVATCIRSVFCPKTSAPPRMLGASRVLTPAKAFLLSCNLKAASEAQNFIPLYSSEKHGRSWIRLLAQIMYFKAPSLFCVKTEKGDVMGCLVAGGWAEHGCKFYGNADSTLFSFSPAFSLCRATNYGDHFLYLNNSNQYEPIGIGFGGQTRMFRMFVGKDLSEIETADSDATYGEGVLMQASGGNLGEDDGEGAGFQKRQKISSIEVWGLGTAADLDEQQAAVDQDQKIRAERRQVDRAQLCDNAFDREFLLGGGAFQTAGGDRGGEAQAVAEQHREARKAAGQ